MLKVLLSTEDSIHAQGFAIYTEDRYILKVLLSIEDSIHAKGFAIY